MTDDSRMTTAEYHRLEIVRTGDASGSWRCQYQRDIEDVWRDESALVENLQGLCWRCVELGKAPVPRGVEDIRGLIQEEPQRVFAVQLEDLGPWYYWGVRAVSTH